MWTIPKVYQASVHLRVLVRETSTTGTRTFYSEYDGVKEDISVFSQKRAFWSYTLICLYKRK